MKRYLLIILCCLALAYIAKIAFGIAHMAHYQTNPFLPILLELSMLTGAVIFPLIGSIWPAKKKIWHYILWAPCILYVIGVSINYLIMIPASPKAEIIGFIHLGFSISIAVLYISDIKRKKAA